MAQNDQNELQNGSGKLAGLKFQIARSLRLLWFVAKFERRGGGGGKDSFFSIKFSNGSFSATRRSWMASDSLLDSYIYVVYENKKMIEKNFSEKYFFDRPKILSLENCRFFKFY